MRVFVVQSEERRPKRAMREAAMEKTRQALEKLALRVAAGQLKKAQNIGAAAARILGRNHGSRYYDWNLEQGVFHYFEHPVHLPAEKALEGKYVIQTEELDLSAVQAVEAYKELSEVERSFRQLKDLVEMRPIYHQRAKRVRAHIFVAALAFLLDRALEKKLKAAWVPMSSAQALEALRTVHVVDIRVGRRDPAWSDRRAIIKRARSSLPLGSATANRSRLKSSKKWLPSDKLKIECLIFNDL